MTEEQYIKQLREELDEALFQDWLQYIEELMSDEDISLSQ